MEAQKLGKHQWKNRVVLILSKTIGNPVFQQQSEGFDPNSTGFKERKLIVYEILPDAFRLKNSQDESWEPSKSLFEIYNQEGVTFKVVLIGLDGGVKLETRELLSTSELFETIDAMPMRRSDLKNKN